MNLISILQLFRMSLRGKISRPYRSGSAKSTRSVPARPADTCTDEICLIIPNEPSNKWVMQAWYLSL